MEINGKNYILSDNIKFDNLCRICLEEKNDFDLKGVETLTSIFEDLCSIKIHENDGLPKNICITCKTETKKCFNFKLKIIQSHKILSKIVSNKKCLLENDNVNSSTNLLEKNEDSIKEENEDICSICKRIFRSAALLKKHLKTHEYNCDKNTRHKLFNKKRKLNVPEEKLYVCSVCSRAFTTSSRMKSHMKKHTNEKPYKCDICEKSFPYSGSLANHRKIHGERKYVCHCGQSFTQKAHLTTHTMMKHTHKKPFMCSICGETFTIKAQLQNHTMQHTGEQKPKRFICEVCEKAFVTATELKLHMRVHTNERPFTCEFCGKKFRSSSHMNSHRKIHTGEKNYVCSYCSKAFRESTSLKTHVRTHTGERPYSCSICNMAFAKSGTLKTHMRVHRNDVKLEPVTDDLIR